jgi:uncharacterized RDD family membrane protein YckC
MNNDAEPASFLRRLGALIYDALLIVALWMMTLFPIVALSDAVVTGPAIQSLLFLELYGFFTYFWRRRGQTLGMLAWHLTLSTVSGERMTLIQVMLRFMAAMASFLCLGLGYFWIFIDPQRRSWPDIFSATRISFQPGH